MYGRLLVRSRRQREATTRPTVRPISRWQCEVRPTRRFAEGARRSSKVPDVTWLFSKWRRGRSVAVRANGREPMVRMAAAGLGIARLPRFLGASPTCAGCPRRARDPGVSSGSGAIATPARSRGEGNDELLGECVAWESGARSPRSDTLCSFPARPSLLQRGRPCCVCAPGLSGCTGSIRPSAAAARRQLVALHCRGRGIASSVAFVRAPAPHQTSVDPGRGQRGNRLQTKRRARERCRRNRRCRRCGSRRRAPAQECRASACIAPLGREAVG